MKGSALLPLFLAAMTPFLVLTLIVTATGLGLVAWKPPILWSYIFGGSVGDNSARSVVSDSSGVYVEGYVNNSGVGAPRGGSLFLAKYDPSGEIVWTRTIGNTNNSFIDGISVGAEGIYLSGGNRGGGAVLKYDLAGNRIWVRQFGIGNSEGIAISVTARGAYVTGVTTPLTNQSYKVPYVSFVREYDLAGNVVWTNEFYNDSAVIGGIYASSSGVYVAAAPVASYQPSGFLVKFDPNGNLVWTRQPGDIGSSVSGDPTGIYACGASVRKYDFNGNLVWTARIDSPDFSGLDDSSVSADSSGVYLSVSTIASHGFLMKYDLNGRKVWSVQMPDISKLQGPIPAYRLATGGGGVYVAGSVRVESGFSHDAAFVGEVSSSASLVFFGVNPPLSFIILGGLIGGSVASLLVFRRFRHRRVRPPRVGQAGRSLVRD